MTTSPFSAKSVKLGILAGLVVIPVLTWRFWKRTPLQIPDQQKAVSISLRYAPLNEAEPATWDPPTPINITANGLVQFGDSIFPPEEIPTRLSPWVFHQPEDFRGITLQVDPNTSTQALIRVVSQVPALSAKVVQQSLVQRGRPGSTVAPIIWFFPDTQRSCFPLPTPPPPPAA